MKTVALVALLTLGLSHSWSTAACQEPGFQNLFHLAGIPGMRREARVDMAPNANALVFQTKKVHYEVPYTRIRQVLLLHSDRRYEGTTYAAAVATFGAGAFLILKKHHMDTAVLNYVNERGGKMGIVLQMETAQGEQFKALLNLQGVSVEEPGDPAAAASGEKKGGDTKK
jgi:hypothetical protein